MAATTTPPPASPGLTTVRTPDQLGQTATSDVDQSIAQQTAPLTGQIDALTGQETAAGQAIDKMFGSLLPAVSTGAANVKAGYDEATVNQNAIFAAAQAQLSQIKQSQAQRAQALAQEMGGPVALSEFTAGLDDQQSLLSNLGAGQMLHTLGYAQAGEQQAQAFAGQVFPLIQSEQQAQSKQYFENQKKSLQDQITQLQSTRGDKITAEKNDLISQERAYALQKTQEALDKIKTQHDWAATQKTLQNDSARLKLSQKQFALQEAGTTGKYKGQTTQQAKALTAQEKLQAQQMNLTTQQYALRKTELATNTKLALTKLATEQRQSWAALVDSAYNPQVGKTIKQTTREPVAKTAAITGKIKDAFQDSGSPTGYSRLVTVFKTPSTHPIHNPNKLVDYLVSNNIPKQTAIRLVRGRLGIPKWNYGQPWPPPKPQRQGPPMPPQTQPGPFNP
jgi:hypothetical protein